MLIRAKFCRTKRLRYISHLQIMGTFRRAVRRAGLPGAYSQGFNPTLNISLSQPLPVGMAGGGEYLDLEITQPVSDNSFKNRLNCFLPEGLRILQARYIPDESGLKSLQALINRAEYHIHPEINISADSARNIFEILLNQEEIKVVRTRRNKPDREYNIRPLVYKAEVLENGKWGFLVSTGSSGNVRPEEIIKALQTIEPDIPEHSVLTFYRAEMYVARGERIISPLQDQIVGGG
ncbi:MAG: TIGR03936 family radical SAM-associated protein [Bacillota bacterium]